MPRKSKRPVKKPEVRVKRVKGAKREDAASISLQHYCAGLEWEVFIDSNSMHSIAIGNQLFRFIYRYPPGDTLIIQSSTDYGATWSDYSVIVPRLRYFTVVPVVRGNQTLVYVIGRRLLFIPGGQAQVSTLSDVWVSRDVLKTFELVTDKAEFGAHEIYHCVADENGKLYLQVSDYPADSSDIWISEDQGYSWKNQRVSATSHSWEPSLRCYHKGKLYLPL